MELRRRRKIARWQADPRALAQDAGFTALDPWQQQALTDSHQTLLLCCGRQTGKSTVTSLAIAREMLKPGAMVACISASERQARELFRKVLAAWRHLGRPIPTARITTTGLELVTGQRLEVFPASSETVRGLSAVTLLCCDEAGWIPDDMYFATAPMLSVSGGRMLALGTPAGKRGWWWSLWQQGDDPDIERIQISSYACPRITRAFLDREAGRVGAWWMDSEYGRPDGGPYFQEPQTAAFRDEDIAAAVQDDITFDSDLFRL